MRNSDHICLLLLLSHSSFALVMVAEVVAAGVEAAAKVESVAIVVAFAE